MTFGERIKELRKEKNLTLSQLANLANLNVMTLSKIENNCYKPSVLTVGKLANIFNESKEELWRLANKQKGKRLMELTNENYHSSEASMEYMGSSQYKAFKSCMQKELAKIKGEYVEESTEALLIGSYIDAYFSDEMEDFKKNHPEILKKDGSLKSEYIKADQIIEFINADPTMKKSLSGQHQVIMTGTIAGVPFKIKIDSYFPGKAIIDQKVMKDMEPIWNEVDHCYENFVEHWGYHYQGAIYREIVRQNTGKTLPFFLSVVTKEKVPSKALLSIDSEDLDLALDEVERLAPIFYKYKRGEALSDEDKRTLEYYGVKECCGKCDYCKEKYMVKNIISYHELDPEQEGKAMERSEQLGFLTGTMDAKDIVLDYYVKENDTHTKDILIEIVNHILNNYDAKIKQ